MLLLLMLVMLVRCAAANADALSTSIKALVLVVQVRERLKERRPWRVIFVRRLDPVVRLTVSCSVAWSYLVEPSAIAAIARAWGFAGSAE